MRIGVGLSSTIPGAPASLTLDWTRRADAGPFSTLATLDRLVYDSLDSLTTARSTRQPPSPRRPPASTRSPAGVSRWESRSARARRTTTRRA